MGTHKDISNFKRGQIEGRKASGKTSSQIAKKLNFNARTVQQIVHNAQSQLQQDENIGDAAWCVKPRPGRDRKLDEAQRREVLGEIKNDNPASFGSIANNFNQHHPPITISPSLARNVAKDANMRRCKMVQKPWLKQGHRDRRMLWTQEIENVDIKEISFTDEASFYVGQQGQLCVMLLIGLTV